jgi:hypothetical protein
MRYLGLIAVGLLMNFAGTAGAQGMYGGEWKLGLGAQTSAANLDAYHMGYGAHGAVAYERSVGMTDSRLGLRGNILNYELDREGTLLPSDFQEYGIGMEALIGPAGRTFEPKVGGHVGYVRQAGDGLSENDLLDVGADVMASLQVTPNLGIQAVVTPLWLIDDEDADYQTRGSVNLQLTLPGA